MIYIHIPFCRQKCSYCNFHFSVNQNLRGEMVAALRREITMRRDELSEKTLQSLYFGGGTPSLLSIYELEEIFNEIQKYYSFSENIEITMEANPDDLNKEFLLGLKSLGINRLSIGTQSFYDEDLKLMNRAHNSTEAETSIKLAQDVGFKNISIDLIYGSPISDFSIWQKNLQKTVDLQIQHISAYALTIEPKTALENWISKKKISPPNESLQNEEFYFMSDFLKENGFEHYEISNFSKPEFYSKHNTSYWQSKPYVGIGPSAHSFDGNKKRSWNIANNAIYIKEISEGKLPSESETLSETDALNEFLMTGLRTSFGVNLELLDSKFSNDIIEELTKSIETKILRNELVIENSFLKIPQEKWFFADGIAADLFILND